MPRWLKRLAALPLLAAFLGLRAAASNTPHADALATTPNIQLAPSDDRATAATDGNPDPPASMLASTTLALTDERTTAERAATDATAEGRYAAAIARYSALARAHPEQAIWQEAARILTHRGGVPHALQ